MDHNFACGFRGSARSGPSLRTFGNLRKYSELWREAWILSSKKQVLTENVPEGKEGV